jgi:hypothetical protein
VSELEIITLALSLVLGLSVAQMLSAAALAIRARKESRLHWLPLSWAAVIFLFHVQYWLAIFGLDEIVPSWTWDWYGPVLVLAILLFFSGALILPAREKDLAAGLLRDFETHGKLALIPVSLYLLLWIPLNVRMGFAWVSPENTTDVVLVAIAVVVFVARAPRARTLATVLYLAVAAWGVFFVWSPSGAG